MIKECKYLNQYEIYKLRQDLMTINTDLFNDTLSVKISTQVNDIINQEKGDNLEENLGNIFIYEFGRKALSIPREFFYKQINVYGLTIYEINGINFSLFQNDEFNIIYDNIVDKKEDAIPKIVKFFKILINKNAGLYI